MLGCSTVCPNCKHEFQCCPPSQQQQCCSNARRSLHALSGGGVVSLAPTATSQGLQSPCLSPQVSPSVPLAFILPPPFSTPLQRTCAPIEPKPETELQRLMDTARALRQSGWYYESVTSNELLKGTSVGTFLVRNSSDPKFLYSLSVQTERGPTSVRLFYTNGYFRLDAQPHLQDAMPVFPGVIELIQHYVQQSRLCRNNAQVWVDPQGKWYSSILLDKPLKKKSGPGSLKHLARLAIHKAIQSTAKPRLSLLPPPHTQLAGLPNSLISYLSEYPFSL